MGVGEFLILGFLAFGIYSLLNKVVKIGEFYLKHKISMEETSTKIVNDLKDSDFEDVFEDIKK